MHQQDCWAETAAGHGICHQVNPWSDGQQAKSTAVTATVAGRAGDPHGLAGSRHTVFEGQGCPQSWRTAGEGRQQVGNVQGKFGSCCRGEEMGLISNVTRRHLVTVHMMAGRGDPAHYRSSSISAEPQHNLGLSLCSPRGAGNFPSRLGFSYFFPVQSTFSAKVAHEPAWLASELEEPPAAAAATHRRGREMLPTEYSGVLGRCRAVGCTHLAAAWQGGHAACVTPPSTPAWLGSCPAPFPPRHPGAGGL